MKSFACVRRLIILSLLVLPVWSDGLETLSSKGYDCVIVPSDVADLGSNASGIIDQMVVDRNDFVRRGDAIAILDDKVERAMYELALKKASSTSEIELRQAYLEHAQREQKRAEDAFTGKAYSVQAVDQAKSDAQQAKIRLLQAKEEQKLAKKELERAEANLARRTIRAPFSGVVMERFKAAGEYVQSEAVIRLAKLDPLHVEVIVPVSQQGKIDKGMKADVRLQDKSWLATVSQVDRVMDAASGTFGVRLELPNPKHAITAGLRCRLDFIETPPKPLEEPKETRLLQSITTQKDVLRPEVEVQKKELKRECIKLGPFDSHDEAQKVLGSERVTDPGATLKEVRWMRKFGYRVVSGELRSKAERETFVAALEQAGIKEYFALHESGGVERVSMGAFGKESAAKNYQKTLADKGITTQLAPWKKLVSHYWVKIGCQSDRE